MLPSLFSEPRTEISLPTERSEAEPDSVLFIGEFSEKKIILEPPEGSSTEMLFSSILIILPETKLALLKLLAPDFKLRACPVPLFGNWLLFEPEEYFVPA